jgi:hypothetical protein
MTKIINVDPKLVRVNEVVGGEYSHLVMNEKEWAEMKGLIKGPESQQLTQNEERRLDQLSCLQLEGEVGREVTVYYNEFRPTEICE